VAFSEFPDSADGGGLRSPRDAIGIRNRLAWQYFAHDSQIFAKLSEWHWVLPHHAHRRMPSSDSEERAPWSNLIDAGD
jgi:hypothetical protein